MPTSSDEKALDWLVDNRKIETVKSAQAMEKLGVDSSDIDAWEWTKQNQNKERSVDIRNKLFSKLTEARRPVDKSKGFPAVDRFLIKNLADKNDTKSISSYMEDRGFITRVKSGEVQVRRPDDKSFVGIEPTDIDLFDFSSWAKEAAQDVTDVGRELVEGGVVAATTGAKVAGAAIGGLAGLAATSAASGLTTATLEAARQTVGRLTGLLPKFEPERIKEAGEAGFLIPGVTGLAGKGLESFGTAFGKIIGKFQRFAKKPEAPTIEKGAEALGAKATPGQLFRSPGIQKIEESLVKAGDFHLGGLVSGLPRQVEVNKRAVQDVAKEIVKNRSFKEAFDTGRGVGKQLLDDVTAKIAPAKTIYETYEKRLGVIKPDTTKLKTLVKKLENEFKFDDDVLSALKSQSEKIDKIKSLADLKSFRTSTGKILRDKKAPRAANQIYDTATQVRSENLIRVANRKGFERAKTDIEEADRIYRSAAQDVDAALIGRGRASKLGPKQTAKEFIGKTKEVERINKILDTDDPSRLQKVKKAFPEVFESLRKQKIEQIANSAELKGEVDPQRLAKIITKMPLRTQVLLFGAKGAKHAKALKDYLDSLPQPFNTSNTANMKDFVKFLNPLTQASSLGRAVFLEIFTNTQLGRSLLQKTGRGLQTPVARGIATGARGLVLPERQSERFITTPEE